MPPAQAGPRRGTPTGPPPPAQTDPRPLRWSKPVGRCAVSRPHLGSEATPLPGSSSSQSVRTRAREEDETGASPENAVSLHILNVQLNALYRRALDRRRYAARRAGGACVRCSEPAADGSSRCARHAALEAERVSPERKRAVDRKRYARRRARGRCTDCGVHAARTARCPACARRSNTRAPAHHGAPAGPPFYTVIELGTREDHGTYESEAEVAACLAFAGLRPDQVEIRSNMPLLALTLTALPQECRR